MIVTLSFAYLLYYILTLCGLFLVCFFFLPLNALYLLNLPTYICFFKKYSANPAILLCLFFILTGIPPAALFLLKFSILSFILSKFNFFLSSFLFINFLVNMFFYAQVFNFKNWSTQTLSNVYSVFKHMCFFSNNNQNILFVVVYSIILFLIFTVLNIFFYLDFLLLVFVHNKSMYKLCW